MCDDMLLSLSSSLTIFQKCIWRKVGWGGGGGMGRKKRQKREKERDERGRKGTQTGLDCSFLCV